MGLFNRGKGKKPEQHAGSASHPDDKSIPAVGNPRKVSVVRMKSVTNFASVEDKEFVVKGNNLDVERDPPLLKSNKTNRIDPLVSIISFDALEYLVMEGHNEAELAVQREGNTDGSVTVNWCNENENTSDESFRKQSGTVEFGPGQRKAKIAVKLYDDEDWNLEATQIVKLSLPGKSESVILGIVNQAHLVVLNNDPFPGGLPIEKKDDKYALVYSFLCHMWILMPSESKWCIWYRCWPGISFVINQLVLIFFVDVLDPNGGGLVDTQANISTLPWLYSLCAVYLLVKFFDYVVLRLEQRLRMGGKAKLSLRNSLNSTATQCTLQELVKNPPGTVSHIMENDVNCAVHNGWIMLFTLWASVFSLIVNLAWTTTINAHNVGTTGVPFTVLLCAIPFVIGIFNLVVLRITYKQSAQGAYEGEKHSDEVNRYGSENMNLRSIVTGFRKGPAAQAEYKRLHAEHNEMMADGDYWRLRVTGTAMAVSYIFTTVMLGVIGSLVATSGFPLSNFVSLFNSLGAFTTTLGGLFNTLNTMVESYGHILKITDLLNSDTRRMQLLKGQKRREALLEKVVNDGSVAPIGNNEMRIQSVEFSFDKHAMMFPPLSVGIEAGQVVAVKSDTSLGKRTVLQLIKRTIRPHEGFISYPAAWRVVYIDPVPQLFDDTLMKNLRFGEVKGVEHSDEEIWDLCRHMGFNPLLIGKGEHDCGLNGSMLSFSDGVMVNLIRGLLASPDVILLPGTLDILGERKGLAVLGKLKKFVEDAKFECLRQEDSMKDANLSVPKTVIVATKFTFIEEQCDGVLEVVKGDELEEVDAVDVVPSVIAPSIETQYL